MNKSKTSEGKTFEANWKESYAGLPIYYLRLQDAAKWNRGEKSSFTPENPYDSLQFKPPFLWLLELKSTKGSSVSFNPEKPYEKPFSKNTKVMIKHTQVKSLMDASTKMGVIAGFIINFRERLLKTKSEPNEVFFVHINDFLIFAKESKKSTINREDCLKYGMRVNFTKKKVNYTYMIEEYIEKSARLYLNKGYLNTIELEETYKWLGDILYKSKNDDVSTKR